MEEKKSTLLSEFQIQYIGPLIIFLGVIRIQSYYSEFGVNILQFIEVGEALTSFLDFIRSILIYFLTYHTTTFLLEEKTDSFHSEKFQKIIEANSFFKRLLYYLFDIAQIVTLIIVFIILFFILSLFAPNYNTNNYLFYLLILGLIMIIIVVIFNEINYKNHVRQRTAKKRKIVYLFFFSLLIIIFVTYDSHIEANKIKETKIYKNVIIELTDAPSIHSNENIYFIGKTNNYVFIHNAQKNNTQVIPNSRIKSITFASP